jgi:hypothetical protein
MQWFILQGIIWMTAIMLFFGCDTAHAGFIFDGSNDRITTTAESPADFANTSFSACFWLKTSSAGTLGVLSKAPNGGGPGWQVRINQTAGKIQQTVYDASSGAAAARPSSANINDDTERHICIVTTTSTTVAATNNVDIYLNGVLSNGTLSSSGLVYSPGASDFRIGLRDNGSYLSGVMDDIRIDSPAFSALEILTMGKSNIKGGGLLSRRPAFYYPMDDCANGTVVVDFTLSVDRSGGGFPGTVLGNAVCRNSPILMGMGWVQ